MREVLEACCRGFMRIVLDFLLDVREECEDVRRRLSPLGVSIANMLDYASPKMSSHVFGRRAGSVEHSTIDGQAAAAANCFRVVCTFCRCVIRAGMADAHE